MYWRRKSKSQPWADLAAAEEEAASSHKKNWTNDDQGSYLSKSFADADADADAYALSDADA